MLHRPSKVIPPPVPIKLSRVLLVEGQTPFHFFEAFLSHLGIAQEIEIIDYGGIAQLRSRLTALAATAEFRSGVTSVGIIMDGEVDPSARKASLEDAVKAAGLKMTPGSKPQVTLFVLPDNESQGMLETLCLEAVRNDPSLKAPYGCVEEFLACLERSGTLGDGSRDAKRVAQAYLATRPRVQLFPGLAAYQGYWPWDCAVFDDLKSFLKSL